MDCHRAARRGPVTDAGIFPHTVKAAKSGCAAGVLAWEVSGDGVPLLIDALLLGDVFIFDTSRWGWGAEYTAGHQESRQMEGFARRIYFFGLCGWYLPH